MNDIFKNPRLLKRALKEVRFKDPKELPPPTRFFFAGISERENFLRYILWLYLGPNYGAMVNTDGILYLYNNGEQIGSIQLLHKKTPFIELDTSYWRNFMGFIAKEAGYED